MRLVFFGKGNERSNNKDQASHFEPKYPGYAYVTLDPDCLFTSDVEHTLQFG